MGMLKDAGEAAKGDQRGRKGGLKGWKNIKLELGLQCAVVMLLKALLMTILTVKLFVFLIYITCNNKKLVAFLQIVAWTFEKKNVKYR